MKKHVYFIVIVIFAVVIAGMFSRVMICPLTHDEQMYVTGGVLTQSLTLYKDFSYLHMPYLAWFYGAFYKLTGTSYYLFWGRMFSFMFMILSGLLIYLISHRISGSVFIALSSLLLFELNELIVHIMPYAWNHPLPMTLSLLAFYLFIPGNTRKRFKAASVLLAGICLGGAIGTRLTYVILPFPFFIVSLFFPGSSDFRKRFVKLILPLLAGITVGLIPTLYFIHRSDFELFWFNNFHCFKINIVWKQLAGYHSGISILSKIKKAWQGMAYPSDVSLGLVILFLFFNLVTEAKRRVGALRQLLSPETALSILLVLFTTAATFQVTPLYISHLAMPLPYFIILVGCFYRATSEASRPVVKLLIICALIVTGFSGGIKLFRCVPDLFYSDRWTAVSVHKTAGRIRNRIGAAKNKGRVATLSPLYAVESGLPVYEELSSGPFLYRIGDLLPDRKRSACIGTSPKSLRALFEMEPPRAVFVGFEGELDLPFIAYAEEHDYARIEGDFEGGVLYIRKDD